MISGEVSGCRPDIRQEMKRTAWIYGKLGLLIDDQPDAAARVARELYDTEALPAWWKVAQSMRCAYEALSAFEEVLEQKDSLRGLVVADRYLPEVCGPGRRPIAWDYPPAKPQENSKSRDLLAALVGRLLADGSTKFHMKFVTSYPYAQVTQVEAEAASTGLRVPWKIRSIELLRQYRQEIYQQTSWRRLLRYGPEPDAPVVGEPDAPVVGKPDEILWKPQELDTAKWRAKAWWPCLEKLAHLLIQRANEAEIPVVLFTGAGASLAQGPHGAGMPLTWELLKRARQRVESEAKDGHSSGERWPPLAAASCLCSGEKDQGHRKRWEGPESPVVWLLEGEIEALDWRLEELFDPDRHQKSDDRELFLKFHRAFRDALYRCDHGYAYHHWLIARMPWTAILTTNFDGFHERAAEAAAQLSGLEPKARAQCLRLGTPVPDSHLRDKPATTLLEVAGQLLEENDRAEVRKLATSLRRRYESEKEPALFKPYGSLYSPSGEIALSIDEMGGFKERFREALQGALGDEEGGAFVVIGHSMRDDFINEILEDPKMALRFQKLQLLWIDPTACTRCAESPENRGKLSSWEKMLGDRKTQCDKTLSQDHKKVRRAGKLIDYSGPIPATALEFLYDLWMIYQGELNPKA